MQLHHCLRKATNYFNRITDNYSIKKKLFALYILCVIIPVIIIDGVLLSSLINKEFRRQADGMANVAQAVEYNLEKTVSDSVFITKDYYINKKIYAFLNTKYNSPYSYFSSFTTLENNSIFDVSLVGRNAAIKLYADNDSIVSGSQFGNLGLVKNQKWYEYFKNSGRDLVVYPYISRDRADGYFNETLRCISVIRKMNYYKGCDKIMKLDIDYTVVENAILNSNYEYPVYICMGDTVLYSNRGSTSAAAEFDILNQEDKKNIGLTRPISFYTQNWNIHVLKQNSGVFQIIRNNLGLIAFMFSFSIFAPILFMQMLNRSFTKRLGELSRHFNSIDKGSDYLEEIKTVRGMDEIGDLMRDYNQMASRMNELIHVVYKGKLKEQEVDIARQNAEVLALQSQINPHFLFNALESIRMRSILKHEDETSEMIYKLSIMMRQSVDWSQDVVTIAEEIKFAQAYLQLQKYRFGEQLCYKISVAPECDSLYIPKLTIVTFVENACVHGIEGKSGSGWIFIEVNCDQQEMILEVEDTGIGMSEEKLRAIWESIEHASIECLKSGGSVGVINACYRLKLFSHDQARFEVESEEGAGCTITIHMPIKCVRRDSYAATDQNCNRTENKNEKRDTENIINKE